MNAPSDTLGAAGLDPAASDFETIFETHYESTARAIARVIHDNGRAEELAVEAFLKLSRNPACARGTCWWLVAPDRDPSRAG